MNRVKLLDLFAQHSDLLNMGSTDDAPSTEWIEKAESALSLVLPNDYKWFLENFGGGDICGDEIYSIYCIPFEEAVGGDLIYQNTIANNYLNEGRLVVSNTDFGEEFYFDTKELKAIYVALGEEHKLYASDFIEFLYKRLMSYI
ncbi:MULTISPECIES: SMI1/KNR4 family protein [Xenorhabdus]|uniref:SMI1/KNR4 family protein n=1 Tax=Xenorhabdus TaxID=626 RepID=UPI00064A4135|nr:MULTISPECIES: SMI1/KNR4 family protein [Xenorhabdus]KLU14849.1 1,3-beta-glucan synthase regulator [Xenorhabdus griffiniae]KOP32682.1 1,3-beta-glucan synthase regulator [Xenorhabdus sp. GDc328]